MALPVATLSLICSLSSFTTRNTLDLIMSSVFLFKTKVAYH